MPASNKYLYCVIEKPKNFEFAMNGLKGERIYLIEADNLAAVVSDFQEKEAGITRENLFTHDNVVNRVLKKYQAAIPAGFGTIVRPDDLKNNLLLANKSRLEKALDEIRGKEEMNLKAVFRDFLPAMRKLAAESPRLANLQKEISGRKLDFRDRVEIGKQVEEELNLKRRAIKNQALKVLNGRYLEFKESEIIGEKDIFDLYFLIRSRDENEFIDRLERLGEQFGEEILFKLSEPAAPYHFIDLPINF